MLLRIGQLAVLLLGLSGRHSQAQTIMIRGELRQSQTGQAVESAILEASLGEQPVWRVRTDANGRFSVEVPVPQGQYQVHMLRNSFPEEVLSVQLTTTDTTLRLLSTVTCPYTQAARRAVRCEGGPRRGIVPVVYGLPGPQT